MHRQLETDLVFDALPFN